MPLGWTVSLNAGELARLYIGGILCGSNGFIYPYTGRPKTREPSIAMHVARPCQHFTRHISLRVGRTRRGSTVMLASVKIVLLRHPYASVTSSSFYRSRIVQLPVSRPHHAMPGNQPVKVYASILKGQEIAVIRNLSIMEQ